MRIDHQLFGTLDVYGLHSLTRLFILFGHFIKDIVIDVDDRQAVNIQSSRLGSAGRRLPLGRGIAMAAVFDVSDFLHPLDMSARQQLERVPLLESAVKKYLAAVKEPMPWALGIWVSVRAFLFWLRWVVPGCGHAEGRRVVSAGGRFHGPAGWFAGVVCGISAGQAGVLASVMMAGVIRV